jgi:molecular chaperone DnaK (HSP70)
MAELTTNLKLQERIYESKTYKLSDDKIEGFVDDLEALKQAIYKNLSTEQYEHPIYSFDFGIAWKDLIGEDRAYVRAEAKRMIQEALLRDSRITDVDQFAFFFEGDTCTCTFTVTSKYGTVGIETEVQI